LELCGVTDFSFAIFFIKC